VLRNGWIVRRGEDDGGKTPDDHEVGVTWENDDEAAQRFI
jgi:hypothetical protein